MGHIIREHKGVYPSVDALVADFRRHFEGFSARLHGEAQGFLPEIDVLSSNLEAMQSYFELTINPLDLGDWHPTLKDSQIFYEACTKNVRAGDHSDSLSTFARMGLKIEFYRGVPENHAHREIHLMRRLCSYSENERVLELDTNGEDVSGKREYFNPDPLKRFSVTLHSVNAFSDWLSAPPVSERRLDGPPS
jgi:hypothetical protein